MSKTVKIKKEKLKKIVNEAITNVLTENVAYSLDCYEQNPENFGELNEMARINVNEPQGSLFPYEKFDVHIWSNDHEPAHFHILTSDWNVSFYISDGKLCKINKQGKDSKIFSYLVKNVPAWLSSPCAILPSITNQQNANLQWIQLHPPKR